MKGQFFIIGAIVIAITLFTLASSLERNPEFVPSDTQGNDIITAYFHVIDSLNQTIISSANSDRDANIQHVLKILQEELFQKQHRIDLFYENAASLPLEMNISIGSPDISLQKTQIFSQ